MVRSGFLFSRLAPCAPLPGRRGCGFASRSAWGIRGARGIRSVREGLRVLRLRVRLISLACLSRRRLGGLELGRGFRHWLNFFCGRLACGGCRSLSCSRNIGICGKIGVHVLLSRHMELAAVESARDAGLEEFLQIVEDALRGFALHVCQCGGPEEEREGADLLRHVLRRERAGVELVLDGAGLVAPGLEALGVQGAVGLDAQEAGQHLSGLGKGAALALSFGLHGAQQLVRAGAEGGRAVAEQIPAGLVELGVLPPVALKAPEGKVCHVLARQHL